MHYTQDDEQNIRFRSLTETDTISSQPGIKNIPGLYDNDPRPHTPSEYARYNGWSAPLQKRNILPDIGQSIFGDSSRSDNTWQQNNSISAVLDNIPTLSSDAFTAYLDTLPPIDTTQHYPNYAQPADITAPANSDRPYFGSVQNNHNVAPIDNTRVSYDYTRYSDPVRQSTSETWNKNRQNLQVGGLVRRPLFPSPENTENNKLTVYGQIFKKYLTDDTENKFIKIAIPYSESNKNFKEALLPDDTKARKLANEWWKLSMLKSDPEAYAAMQYASSRGEDFVWVPATYLFTRGVSPLSPYHWQKEIYYYTRQNKDTDQLWRDLTGIKEWDFEELYKDNSTSKLKDTPVALKDNSEEIAESQKNTTFEQSMKVLDQIVRNRENKNVDLEEKQTEFLKPEYFVGPFLYLIGQKYVPKRGGIGGGGKAGNKTSVISKALRYIDWTLRDRFGTKLTFSRKVMGTKSICGALGRIIPYVGWHWTAASAADAGYNLGKRYGISKWGSLYREYKTDKERKELERMILELIKDNNANKSKIEESDSSLRRD